MDSRSFDRLARSLAVPKTRRGLLGALAALGTGLLGARAADAQVTQAQCGNKLCASNPAVCTDGCVCCGYSNGNSRCRPPGTCGSGTVVCPPGQVLGPSGVCAAPTTTTSTTTTTTTATTAPPNCGAGFGACPGSCVCIISSVSTGDPFVCVAGPNSGSLQQCAGTTSCPSGEICTGGIVCRTACSTPV